MILKNQYMNCPNSVNKVRTTFPIRCKRFKKGDLYQIIASLGGSGTGIVLIRTVRSATTQKQTST